MDMKVSLIRNLNLQSDPYVNIKAEANSITNAYIEWNMQSTTTDITYH